MPRWVVDGAAGASGDGLLPEADVTKPPSLSETEQWLADERAKILVAPPSEGNYMYLRNDKDERVYIRLKKANQARGGGHRAGVALCGTPLTPCLRWSTWWPEMHRLRVRGCSCCRASCWMCPWLP